MYQRLRMIVAAPRVAAYGPEVALLIQFARETASKLSDAVREVVESIQALHSRVTPSEASPAMLEEFKDSVASFTPLLAVLDTTWENVQISSCHVLLEGKIVP